MVCYYLKNSFILPVPNVHAFVPRQAALKPEETLFM